MELNFLGRGAAFNQKEGNNSAYFISNNQLFLIDCGENIFERIIRINLLDGIENINLMITHTHSDHIGSLGSLVLYCYYELHMPLNIIIPENAKYLADILSLLNIFGCTKSMYSYIDERKLDNKYDAFKDFRYIETSHCDELNCYGLLFTTEEGIVYYSGDTNETNIIKSLILSGQPIDKVYIDTTTADFSGNVHLNINILEKTISNELKKKVYCMHFNNVDCIDEATKIGFNVVQNITDKNYVKCKKRW